MKSTHHMFSAVTVIVYDAVHSYNLLILPFIIGAVLIDVDHLFDFYLRYRRITFSVKELSESLAQYERFILPFHCIEFLCFSTLLSLISMNANIIYFTLGFFLHYALDVIFNGYSSVWQMSLLYRMFKWKVNFNARRNNSD